MRSKVATFLILLLVTGLVLSGCNLRDILLANQLVSYSDMKYNRPDMEAFQSTLEQSCDTAREEKSIQKLEKAILGFYQVYDDFYTNMNLAYIGYTRDLTDSYWEEEYYFCVENSTTADAGLDTLFRSLANSPLRETLETDEYFGAGYFDSYEGESIYDEYMMELLTKEAQLQAQYQTINGQAVDCEYYSDIYFTTYGSQMAQVLLELVQLRQQIATYAGYSEYTQFAYDFYHVRDYTPQEAISYLADVQAELVPLYRKLNQSDFWDGVSIGYSSEANMLRYVRSMARNMGGVIEQAFTAMEKTKVYDITYSENKYNSSYELYLSSYNMPYIFLCPTGGEYDKLTFAHEFGHFCCDFVTYGGAVQSVDVAEIFSQAMEYLSLTYADDVGDLEKYKMADCLSVYVEQAAYASFEHQLYGLTGNELTVENIQKLYEQVMTAYGVDAPGWDSRDYVCVPHFYESPLYVVSYVLSNDIALQIFELEQAEKGKGLECYVNNMTSSQPYLMAFLEEAGLQSPFEAGRLMQVKKTLESILQ